MRISRTCACLVLCLSWAIYAGADQWPPTFWDSTSGEKTRKTLLALAKPMGLPCLGCTCPHLIVACSFASPVLVQSCLAYGAPLPGRRRPACYYEADSRRCNKLCSCRTPAANRTALLEATSPIAWNRPRAALACLQTIMAKRTSGGGAAGGVEDGAEIFEEARAKARPQLRGKSRTR